jgi:hypothetical protein
MSPSARSGPGLPNRNDETGCHESEDEGGTSSKEDEIEKAQKRCWSKKHQSDVRENSHVLVSDNRSIAQGRYIELCPLLAHVTRSFPNLCQRPRDRCQLPAQLVVSTDGSGNAGVCPGLYPASSGEIVKCLSSPLPLNQSTALCGRTDQPGGFRRSVRPSPLFPTT